MADDAGALLVRSGLVTSSALDDARAHAEHLAQAPAGTEDELDLAHAEAQRLACGRERDLGRRGEVLDPVAGGPGGRGLGLADEGRLDSRGSHGYGHVTT